MQADAGIQAAIAAAEGRRVDDLNRGITAETRRISALTDELAALRVDAGVLASQKALAEQQVQELQAGVEAAKARCAELSSALADHSRSAKAQHEDLLAQLRPSAGRIIDMTASLMTKCFESANMQHFYLPVDSCNMRIERRYAEG